MIDPLSLGVSYLERRSRATALGVLFAAGGALSIITTLLPHPATVQERPALVIAVVALVAAALLLRIGHRFPLLVFEVLVAAGSILIAFGIHVAGFEGGTPPNAFFYVWVAIYVCHFFTPAHAAFQLALASAAHLTVLIVDQSSSVILSGWIFTWGITIVTGIVVGWLSLRVKTLAETDSLTGLRNRRAWDIELERELANSARASRSVCVMLLDLDGLKEVNDRDGHQAGDRLLRSTGAAWSEVVRGGDLLARLGGDEFGLLLPGCTPSGAEKLLGRLRETSEGTFCVGIAEWDGKESPEDLVRRADGDLYRAKSARPARTAVGQRLTD